MSEEGRPVKKLDHLIARLAHPEPLFELISETLQLPVAWPLRSYPSFTSGGVTLGNLYDNQLTIAAEKIYGLDVRLVE